MNIIRIMFNMVTWLTAQGRGAPVDRHAVVAAALAVRRHAGAEALAVAALAAGAGIGQAVHVEPGDVHLSSGGDTGVRRSSGTKEMELICENNYNYMNTYKQKWFILLIINILVIYMYIYSISIFDIFHLFS